VTADTRERLSSARMLAAQAVRVSERVRERVSDGPANLEDLASEMAIVAERMERKHD